MNRLLWYGIPRSLTRRLLGATIGCQGIAVFLWAITAYQLAVAEGRGGPTTFLLSGIAVAVLAALSAGTLRRPFGVTLGWLVQAACVAMCFVVPLMAGVVLLFGGLWLVSLVQGARIDDLREDAAAKYAAYEEQHGRRPGEEPTSAGSDAGGAGIAAASREGDSTRRPATQSD